MTLRELIKVLDECVELAVYDKDGLHIKHFYDEDYPTNWSKEFLEKEVIKLEPYIDFDIVRNYSFPPASLSVYLEDYYDINDTEEEI